MQCARRFETISGVKRSRDCKKRNNSLLVQSSPWAAIIAMERATKRKQHLDSYPDMPLIGESTWMYSIVFEKLYFGNRFQKPPYSASVFAQLQCLADYMCKRKAYP